MSEKLNYQVEDAVLADLLGKQNFSKKESAVLEIVKNAYDSGSKKLNIIFDKDKENRIRIIFRDYGEGMNHDDIVNFWMHVGKSSRGYLNKDGDRVFAGSKGIGKFALARLGDNIQIFSKKKEYSGILWETNWNSAKISESSIIEEEGTKIVIQNLKDRWTKRAVELLNDYLMKVYNDDIMKIVISWFDDNFKVENYFKSNRIGVDYLSEIKLEYKASKKILSVRIKSDEFNESAEVMTSESSISEKNTRINILNLISTNGKLVDYDANEKDDILTKLGDFKGSLFFKLKPRKDDIERFEYKHATLVNYGEKPDVILYRNAFSIESLEGSSDWLDITSRARKSPAAATHPSGRWRVRSNQLFGYINIDKSRNKNIEDLANRQGVVNNIYFELMKVIINSGLSEFELFRQNIIRDINNYKMEEFNVNYEKKKEEPSIDEMLEELSKNSNDEYKSKVSQIKSKIGFDKNKQEEEKRRFDEMKEALHYEGQLLNVLATSQLRVSASGHEVKNSKNNIISAPGLLRKAISRKLSLEKLRAEKVPQSRNIPKLLDTLEDNTDKIINLTDVMLDSMEKSKFKKKSYKLNELVRDITENWEKAYNNVEFDCEAPEQYVTISYDTLSVILSNLILNSIQQSKGSVVISIHMIIQDNKLNITYSDNGEGLVSIYKDNPMKILDPLESSREEGHGLGMWILNNTLIKNNGHVTQIDGNNGFMLKAELELE